MSDGGSPQSPNTPTPTPPPAASSPLQNPQVLTALITGMVTVVVAIVGLVPTILQSAAAAPTPTPPPTVIVVTATPTEVIVLPTETPIPPTATEAPIEAIVLPSETPVSPTATEAPTETPIPATEAAQVNERPNVRLIFDNASFTLVNLANQELSLEGVSFSSASGYWEARQWGPSLYTRVPSQNCLRLRDMRTGRRNPPSDCRSLLGLIEVGQPAIFWTNTDSFTVERNGDVLAECSTRQSPCELRLRRQ
jgi:hypothetical protein